MSNAHRAFILSRLMPGERTVFERVESEIRVTLTRSPVDALTYPLSSTVSEAVAAALVAIFEREGWKAWLRRSGGFSLQLVSKPGDRR